MDDSEVLVQIRKLCAKMVDSIDKWPPYEGRQGMRYAYKDVLGVIENAERVSPGPSDVEFADTNTDWLIVEARAKAYADVLTDGIRSVMANQAEK